MRISLDMVKIPKITMILLLPMVLLLPSYAMALTQILGIRHWAGPDHTRIVIDASDEAQYDVEKGERKISIDLKNVAQPGTVPAEIVLNKPGIDKIILTPLPERTVRVQLLLPGNFTTKVFSLKKFKGKPDRVVIDIEFPEKASSDTKNNENSPNPIFPRSPFKK